MEWIKSNIGFIMTLAIVASGLVGTWIGFGFRIGHLEKAVEKLEKNGDDLEHEVHAHHNNRDIHIDPARDQRAWKEFQDALTKRFDRVEEKLERLMIHTPAPPTV